MLNDILYLNRRQVAGLVEQFLLLQVARVENISYLLVDRILNDDTVDNNGISGLTLTVQTIA
jgi:hypothetical protein